jgi:hypothetical protein
LLQKYPLPRENRNAHASPKYLNTPSLKGAIACTQFLKVGLPPSRACMIFKKILPIFIFSGILHPSFASEIGLPLPRENRNTHARPLRYFCVCGGGGADLIRIK